MALALFPHNKTAYEAALRMMHNTGRAAVIHPTGTGKSFIAFNLAFEHPNQSICWLSPSEYIYKTQLENLAATNENILPSNIYFYTYAKLSLLTEAELSAIQPDYIILDEFHRCGAQVWGQSVQQLIAHYPSVPVLGLSATNIRYLDNQRDMADELFDGNIASHMTLGEALVRGILRSPTYIQTIYSYKKNLDKLTERVNRAPNLAVRDKALQLLDKLRRSLELADGLDKVFHKHMPNVCGKYIVFCANKEHMDEMLGKVAEWFRLVDEQPHVYQVYCESSNSGATFRAFKADNSKHLKLLYCIDMLNEGIHIEDVDGVILIRPTVSPIVYKQQIGRALSVGKCKHPVIFDIVNNFENLYSIGVIEEEMKNALSYYHHWDNENSRSTEPFLLIDVILDCRQLFQQLENTLSASWEVMYNYAKMYYETYHNLKVPTRYRTEDGYPLGSWIETQRRIYAGSLDGALTKERISLLDEIGMVWGPMHEFVWQKNLSEARAYYEIHKNLNTTINTVTDSGFQLGKWLCQLRTYRKNINAYKNYLTPERISALDEMGMVWNTPDHRWQHNYLEAKAFYLKNGHLDVPLKHVTSNGICLGRWIHRLRAIRYDKTNSATGLTDEQITQLDNIGMIWTRHFDRLWKKGFDEAKRYLDKYGNLSVPAAYISESGYALGKWLGYQRSNASNLSSERRSQLESLGVVLQKKDSWQTRYQLVKAFYEANRHFDIPYDYVPNGIGLRKWLIEQCNIYHGKIKGKRLSQEQIDALEAIGFDWMTTQERSLKDSWQTRYQLVKAFYEANRHFDIPCDYTSNGIWLRKWLVEQCNVYHGKIKGKRLSQEQIDALEAIGFDWMTAPERAWESRFNEVKAFYLEHGHLSIPSTTSKLKGLKKWLKSQHLAAQQGKLNDSQVEKLKSIGCGVV